MWRIRARNPGKKFVKRDEVARAIMIECGTSPMTFYNNIKAMVKLGWIKKSKRRFYISKKDLEEDY